MKKTFSELLPIGSIVSLKKGSKRIMIIGRMQQDINTKRLFDYSACLYPEGYLSAEDIYLFSDEDIDKVYYVGMQDEEEFLFRGKMEEFLQKRK